MASRRRWMVVAAAALAMVLGWSVWSPSRSSRRDTTGSRHARPAPLAAAHRAPALDSQPRARPAAPAPADFEAARTGIPACDDYVARTMNCAQLPDDAKIALAEASKAWAELTAAGPRPDLEASCRDTAAAQQDALAAMGC